MFWTKRVHLLPAIFFQFYLEEWWGMDMCKLGMISQELLKIEVKLLLGTNRKSYIICCVHWHNNG